MSLGRYIKLIEKNQLKKILNRFSEGLLFFSKLTISTVLKVL